MNSKHLLIHLKQKISDLLQMEIIKSSQHLMIKAFQLINESSKESSKFSFLLQLILLISFSSVLSRDGGPLEGIDSNIDSVRKSRNIFKTKKQSMDTTE